jgi:ABC-type cobalt transport system substrate-binding protein
MEIISNRDEDGNFVGAGDAWTEDKIEELLKKYNPNGKLWYSSKNKEKEASNEGNE